MISAGLTKPQDGRTEMPARLVKGEKYRFVIRGNCLQEPVEETVTFIGYTPCPATVIVLDRLQRRLYCGRDMLFID